VRILATNTAGGRIRFVTDSPYVTLYVKLGNYDDRDHFTACGYCGTDLYEGERYLHTFRPGKNHPEEYFSTVTLGEGKHDLTVNMPLYSDVREVYVGVARDSEISHAPGYKYEKTVVFYGSSITQGGCASRPGNCYQNILARKLGFDYVNLGFSGGAKAEDAIIEYIAGLDMGVFVYDYDHNAPTVEHLDATHEKMFLAIREKHPELPVIFMSRPSAIDRKRREIIETTYNNAIARGDKNVYIVKAAELNKKDGTVDGCHPNDLGFYYMACDLAPVLEKALEDSEK
jgi:lysophospholipase L1-like esterase